LGKSRRWGKGTCAPGRQTVFGGGLSRLRRRNGSEGGPEPRKSRRRRGKARSDGRIKRVNRAVRRRVFFTRRKGKSKKRTQKEEL